MVTDRLHFWAYDSCEFQLVASAVNYDIRTNQSTTAFNNVDVSLDTTIRTDQNIYFSINNTNNATVSLSATEGSLSYTNPITTNLYLTNTSGSTANIKILLSGR